MLAAAISRWVMLLLAKHAPHLRNIFGGGSGGSLPLVAMAGIATWGTGLVGALFLTSCSVVGSAITGASIPATAVQRAGHDGATPILVSSADLAQAEVEAEVAAKAGQAPPVNGLYDAGRAAKAVRQVFTESSK